MLVKEEGLKKILDINLNIALKPEQWTRILEQVVLVVLILGRWLLPKGKLTRDQFSQLMLVYIGMAADIVEVFEAFRESKVMLEPALTYAILGVWSWSLLQFCLVLGGGHRGRKARLTSMAPGEHPFDNNNRVLEVPELKFQFQFPSLVPVNSECNSRTWYLTNSKYQVHYVMRNFYSKVDFPSNFIILLTVLILNRKDVHNKNEIWINFSISASIF